VLYNRHERLRLRYRPRSALTPALAERLRTHKDDLLAILRTQEGPDAAASASAWEDCFDPPDPCPNCGGLLCWWTLLGNQRCLVCDPPVKAMGALKRAERIRRRCGIPSPPGAKEMLADLKKWVNT
jgi:hypothetical protein